MSIKQRILGLLGDSSFRAPVIKLLSGTGVAFLIGYLAKIVLLRIYPAEYWGIADYIVTWVTILVPLSSLRYEDALMLPENRRTSAHAYLLAISTVVISTVLLLVLIAFFPPVIEFFAEREIGRWALFLPLALFANRVAKISELWLSRQESFGTISIGQIVQSGSMTTIRVTSGLIGPGPGGLLWGFIGGYLLSTASYLKRVWNTLKDSLQGPVKKQELNYVARRYRKFPLFTMPAALLSALITRMPFLAIPEFFDWEIMGQFSQGFNVLFVPLSLLGSSVAQVFFVRAVEVNRAGKLAQFSANVHGRLVLMSIFPVSILMVAGGDIFHALFGAEWRVSGDFLLWIAPWIMLSIVASPMTRLFDVLERQKLEFITVFVMFIVILGAVYLGGQSGDIHQLVLYLGVGGTLVRFGQIILLLKLSGTSLRDTLSPYFKYTLAVAPILIGVWFATTFDSPWISTSAAALGGLLFAAYVFIAERSRSRSKASETSSDA
ncbi:MAG: oligosaccharide flippase family protein [Rhodothermales bacterium]|nr:oligosaccharide flippase family protein [Rhodothermales bacterium]MDG2017728.1 oligosaccharide flippase family protein [Rhodothermales bacterium]